MGLVHNSVWNERMFLKKEGDVLLIAIIYIIIAIITIVAYLLWGDEREKEYVFFIIFAFVFLFLLYFLIYILPTLFADWTHNLFN